MTTPNPTADLPDNDGPSGTSRFFTQEELNTAIEAARQQEKDKLYPTISKSDERSKAMQAELADLRKFQKSQEAAEAKRQAEIEKARKDAEEAEMSAKDLIAKRDADYQAKLESLRAESVQQMALMQKEIEFNRLQAYTQRRVNEEQDEIAPELIDFIGGDTPEEVEASIERVKAKTAAIVENMKSAGIRQRAAMPGVAPSAGTNGVGPMDTPGQRELSAEDIANMGMGEFAELRKRVGLAGANNQGLFRA